VFVLRSTPNHKPSNLEKLSHGSDEVGIGCLVQPMARNTCPLATCYILFTLNLWPFIRICNYRRLDDEIYCYLWRLMKERYAGRTTSWTWSRTASRRSLSGIVHWVWRWYKSSKVKLKPFNLQNNQQCHGYSQTKGQDQKNFLKGHHYIASLCHLTDI
jgi:hypothetical protein